MTVWRHEFPIAGSSTLFESKDAKARPLAMIMREGERWAVYLPPVGLTQPAAVLPDKESAMRSAEGSLTHETVNRYLE